MLSNFDLNDISEHYNFPLTEVLMKDELRAISPRDGNYIINLQSSTQGNGTHWVCSVIRGNNLFYFDPFGVLPPEEVITFCRRIPKSHLGYSEKHIQHIKGETCGFYVAGFLIHLHNNPKMDLYTASKKFIEMFDYDTAKINGILKTYFRNLPKSRGFKLLDRLYSESI